MQPFRFIYLLSSLAVNHSILFTFSSILGFSLVSHIVLLVVASNTLFLVKYFRFIQSSSGPTFLKTAYVLAFLIDLYIAFMIFIVKLKVFYLVL